VRLLPATLLAALAAVALTPATAGASCVSAVSWNGATYVGVGVPVSHGSALKGGERPACNDTITSPPTPPEQPAPVQLHRIKGMPTKLGVALDNEAYLALGTLPQLPGHPLYRKWRSSPPSDRCGTPFTVRGRVLYPPFPGSPIAVRTSDGVERTLVITSGTVVKGLGKRPIVGEGLRLRATVRQCLDSLVASRVTKR
jgi:hypothetical protein